MFGTATEFSVLHISLTHLVSPYMPITDITQDNIPNFYHKQLSC